MRKSIMTGMAVAVMALSTACEEFTEVIPSGPQQELEDQAVQDVPPADTEEKTSEEEEPEDSLIKYVILQGEQQSTLTYQDTEVSRIKFRARFDSTAMYQTAMKENQGDINKLYGVSDCNSYHHTNSARFGWRWYEDKLEIWAYTYRNGERKFARIDTVAIDSFNEYEIEFQENKYVFRLNGKELEMPRHCGSSAQGYKLFPYFGGDETAPHDINIWIEELEE